jgi:hypothetical protein
MYLVMAICDARNLITLLVAALLVLFACHTKHATDAPGVVISICV